MIAMPCSAIGPLRTTRSPGCAPSDEIERSCIKTPRPVVVMKQPSALPRSTTFVSPVTRSTPAVAAAARIDATIRSSCASAKPSSRMNAALTQSGRAPAIATSFTVPFTARSPMSPPGKKSGVTT
jgi:hypothetical protein